MKNKNNQILGWILFGIITLSTLIGLILDVAARRSGGSISMPDTLTGLAPVTFALVGALILSRQPRSWLGWLMMGPGLSFFIIVDAVFLPYVQYQLPAPENPSFLFHLLLWFSGWNWVLIIFPVLFTLVIFPTGRPLTRRWGWLIYIGLALMLVIVFFATFSKELIYASGGIDWTLPNPIGFIPPELEEPLLTPFLIAMPVWVVLCAIAMLVRFRRSTGIERQQIKWLLFAAVIFALFYIPTFIQDDYNNAENLWNYLLFVGLLGFPAAIAIAILRYRLYDIDIILRRTLSYSILTAVLGLVYFGGVVLLQNVFGGLFGSTDSPLITVISTLAIAALFNPLRIRIQEFIDRRFFRSKYDAGKALTDFAAVARDEVDMGRLSGALLSVIETTMQPEQTNLWLRDSAKAK